MFSYFTYNQKRLATRPGFTLVEMLIAMAVTLLMMAAIGRGFAFVGERVKDSRASLQLSADLRDVTTRLRSELERCTVDLIPNTDGPDQAGYFVYYEGPVTDATSSLFGAFRDPEDTTNSLLPHSRYGDFDDYIAFTAVAPPGSWFTGKVPRYILNERSGLAYTLANAFDPVVIRSKYAEIIYFTSPEYVETTLAAGIAPEYVDADESGLPDRIRLHRRVLLIRPDLNGPDGRLPEPTFAPPATPPTTKFMRADDWPIATLNTVIAAGGTSEGWWYGMAAIHQQCDLSVRRVLNNVGTPIARQPPSPEPLQNTVAANSLSDLSLPHNRFAHIRVPNSVLTGGGGSAPSSMPILALGNPPTPTIFDNTTDPTVTPVNRIAPPTTTSAGQPVFTPQRLCGFLRPEFVLGTDFIHYDPDVDAWGRGRRGEDVVINNVLAFDIKIFDPDATFFTTDGSGASSSLVVGPNDAGYREALNTAASNVANSRSRGEIKGGYVDLCYPVLAGGSLRGWQDRVLDRLNSTPSAVTTTDEYLITPFSGIQLRSNAVNTAYTNALYRSGRIVTTGNVIRLFQPAYDTFTSFYERDGILQQRNGITNEGTLWTTTTTASVVDLGSDGLDGLGIYGPGAAGEVTGVFGADDLGEHETQPPFLTPASSIQISIRLENPSNRSIRQSSVIHRGKR